jgi:hypothetical protein
MWMTWLNRMSHAKAYPLVGLSPSLIGIAKAYPLVGLTRIFKDLSQYITTGLKVKHLSINNKKTAAGRPFYLKQENICGPWREVTSPV